MTLVRMVGILALSLVGGCEAADVTDVDLDEPVTAQARALAVNTQLDPDFGGGDGRVIAGTGAISANAITDAGGHVVFAATRVENGHNAATVGRVGVLGDSDSAWRWDGSDLHASESTAKDVFVRGLDTYVVGSGKWNGLREGYLVKLNAQAEPQTGFGTNGVVKIWPLLFSDFEALRVERDGAGHIVVMGLGFYDGLPSASGSQAYVLVARFDENTGAMDESYGTNGWALQQLTGWDSAFVRPTPGYPLLVPLMAVGAGRQDVVVETPTGSLFRFDKNGHLDGGFDAPRAGQVITDLAVAKDGRVFSLLGFNREVWSFTSAGDPDTRFGGDGRVSLASNAVPDLKSLEKLVYSDALARLYVTGTETRKVSNNNVSRVFTTALWPDGEIDASFGDNGRVLTDFHDVASEGPTAIAMQGELLLIAATGDDNSHVPLARYVIDVGHFWEPCHASTHPGVIGTCNDPTFVCVKRPPPEAPTTLCTPQIVIPSPPSFPL
jgi:hypothetical protein